MASTVLRSVSKLLQLNFSWEGIKTLPFGGTMLAFDSLNPYDALGVIIAESPQALVEEIRRIRTPIKIHFIVPYGNGARHAAYYTGDVKAQRIESDVTTTNIKRPRVSKIR